MTVIYRECPVSIWILGTMNKCLRNFMYRKYRVSDKSVKNLKISVPLFSFLADVKRRFVNTDE